MERKKRRAWSREGSSLPSPHAFFAPLFTISAHHYFGTWDRLKELQPIAKYLRHCTVFWLKKPCDSPSFPYQSCFVAIQDHAPNLEEQLWMEGRREVSIMSHRPVTSNDLKQERWFSCRSVSTFLQLAVVLSKLTMDFKTTYARQKYNHELWIWGQEWPPTVADPVGFIIFGLKLVGGGGLIFKPNWGPKGRRKFFGRPPPHLISRSGSGTDPYWQILVDIVQCLHYPIASLFVRGV